MSTLGNTTNNQQLNAAGTWYAASLVGPAFGAGVPKSLNSVRFFATSVANPGSLATSDLTCSLYSDLNGSPNTLLEGPVSCVAVPAGNSTWVDWTGFTTTLTAGQMYWLVWKNANGTPATNNVTYRTGNNGTYVGVGQCVGSTTYGSGVVKNTTNSGTSWNQVAYSSCGWRVGYSDGSYDGMPVNNIGQLGASSIAFGKQEIGVRFTSPPVVLNVAGLGMAVIKNGSPAGNLRLRLYTGSGANIVLRGTTSVIAAANVGSASGFMYSAYFPSVVPVAANSNCYVMIGDDNAADTSGNGYNSLDYTVNNDPNSLALLPFGGTYYRSTIPDNTATPVVPSDTVTDFLCGGFLLDSVGGEYGLPGTAFGGVLQGGEM